MMAMYDGSALDYKGELWKCRVPACKRKIHIASFYCCSNCLRQHRTEPGPKGHTGMCDSRNSMRDECNTRELESLRQPGTRST